MLCCAGQVSVHGEDPNVGELFHCADCYVTLVVVADQCCSPAVPPGTPVGLPFKLEPRSPADLLRQQVSSAPCTGRQHSSAPVSSEHWAGQVPGVMAVAGWRGGAAGGPGAAQGAAAAEGGTGGG
jgi:hypothetical protein